MTLASLRVLVVGGGIAGLGIAGALRRAGADVSLLERAPAWRPLGAGLMLQPNAVAAVDALGVDVRPIGQRLASATLTDPGGRVLTHSDLAALEAEHGPALGVTRPALHERLFAGAEGVPMRLGRSVRRLAESGRVEVETEDGAETYDLVIATDGLRSGVRAALYGAADPGVVYSGYTCWRALFEGMALDGAMEMWGRGKRVGLVPMRAGQTYAFLVANAPAHAPSPDLDGVRALFAEFGGRAPEALAALTPERLLHNDIEEVAEIRWGTPRVWLLGDAAHALTPNMGQGAGLALEDAAEAMGILAASTDLASAHARFVAARDRRVRTVKERSRTFGKIAQWESAPACWLRNRLVALTPASAADGTLRDLYRWRPGQA